MASGFFNRSATHWLVKTSDLVLAVNDNGGAKSATKLNSFLGYFPHRKKSIALPGNRGGFRCGYLNALQDLRYLWLKSSFVLALHPDVFLLPRAFDNIGTLIIKHQDAAFFVTRFRGSDKGVDVDLMLFRPPLMQDAFPGWTDWCSCNSSVPKECMALPLVTMYSPERQLMTRIKQSKFKRVEMCSRNSMLRTPDALGVYHTHWKVEITPYLTVDKHAAAMSYSTDNMHKRPRGQPPPKLNNNPDGSCLVRVGAGSKMKEDSVNLRTNASYSPRNTNRYSRGPK